MNERQAEGMARFHERFAKAARSEANKAGRTGDRLLKDAETAEQRAAALRCSGFVPSATFDGSEGQHCIGCGHPKAWHR